MSKQLTFSAAAAVLTMAAFAAVAGLAGLPAERSGQLAGNAPLIELRATR